MAENYYHSLRLRIEFEKHDKPHANYRLPVSEGEGKYFCSDCQTILANLRSSGHGRAA